MKTVYMVLGLVGLLIAAALLIPSNNLTGHVVKERSCGELGCSELCDQEPGAADTCSKGEVCCPTQWSSGVCDYRANCDKILEYSLYQPLETYQDSIREQPQAVTADWRSFFLPLLACAAIIAYFMHRRKSWE